MNPILYFLRDIRKTGAVAPSSRYLANDMVRFLRKKTACNAAPLRILELGPGTGTLTKAICSAMRPEDRLDMVEINPHFCRMLRRKFKQPGIRVIYGDLLEFDPDAPYDYVFSSIPYESIPESVTSLMWKKKLSLCKPNGLISYYKYVNFNFFRCKFEKELVRDYCIDKTLVFRNLPPAQLFTLRVRQPETSNMHGSGMEFKMNVPKKAVIKRVGKNSAKSSNSKAALSA
ncbi:MAG: methyltransferase domain-containing protein [Balneolales bacterium]|nr:methyltransferase domain-containing protein [Balneolales bacterium]